MHTSNVNNTYWCADDKNSDGHFDSIIDNDIDNNNDNKYQTQRANRCYTNIKSTNDATLMTMQFA